jgi:lipopolysaccharide transport system permease protein/teichoic acid transport system permease protein
MLVYFFVFGVLFGLGGRGRDARFSMYILIGVVIWRFISSSLGQAANCIRGNRGLIHEINFPKAVLPIAVTCARFYDLLCGLLVLGVALLVAGFWPTAQMLWVPLLLTFVLMFVTGVVLLVAFLGAFFADTSNVLDVALRLAFYLSPIFYYVRSKPGIPPEHVFLQNHQLLYRVYMLNPVAGFFECFRDALLWHVTPDPWMMGYLGAVSAGVLVVGFAVFARGEGTFAKYI